VPTAKEAMEAYLAAWNTSDPEMSAACLSKAMTEDAIMAIHHLKRADGKVFRT